MTYIGNYAVEPTRAVMLSCHHCEVKWDGCSAASDCPNCGTPKSYEGADQGACLCERCRVLTTIDLDEAFARADAPREFDVDALLGEPMEIVVTWPGDDDG